MKIKLIEKYKYFFNKKYYKDYNFLFNDKLIFFLIEEIKQYCNSVGYSFVVYNRRFVKDFHLYFSSILSMYSDKIKVYIVFSQNKKSFYVSFESYEKFNFYMYLKIYFNFTTVINSFLFNDKVSIRYFNDKKQNHFITFDIDGKSIRKRSKLFLFLKSEKNKLHMVNLKLRSFNA